MIVAPGGGFTDLMIKYGGVRVAKALNAVGVDAFILKYRLIYTDPTIPLPAPGKPTPPSPRRSDDTGQIVIGPQTGQNILESAHDDVRRAITWLRAHAANYKIQENQIGIIGGSAGGYLALALAIGEPAYRPDFAAIIYGPDNGDKPVPADAPPIFITVAADDTWAGPLAFNLYQAWREADRPAELHIFQSGGHGFLNYGAGGDFYLDRFTDWMRGNGWIPKRQEGNAAMFR